MRKTIFFFTLLLLQCLGVKAQPVILRIPDTVAISGEQLTVPVEVEQFNSINTFQFSLSWDTALAVMDIMPHPAISNVIIGEFEGYANFSWIGPAEGVSFADNTALFNLSFDLKGCPQDSTLIRFDPAYLSPQFAQVNNNTLELLPFDTIPGRLAISQPELVALQDTVICYPDALALQSSCGNCVEYEWNNGAQGSQLTVDSAASYIITATNDDGCTFTDSVQVAVDTFTVQELIDTVLCPEMEVALMMDTSYQSFAWSTGDTTASIAVIQADQYTVTVTNDNQCAASDTSVVESLDLPLAIVFADPPLLCPGDTTVLSLDTLSVEQISWLSAEGSLLAADTTTFYFSPDSSMNVLAVVSNRCGVDSTLVKLGVVFFEADAGRDTCIGEGQTIQLQASGGVAYEWLEGEYPVDNSMIADPIAQPKDSSFFYVRISSEEDCKIIDSVLVAVADAPAAFIKRINLITPNGDGFNDALFFPDLKKFPDNNLQVFNRWGQLVYQKEGYQQDDELWDGRKNGQPLPAGEYFYVLEVNGEHIQQTLSIFRE